MDVMRSGVSTLGCALSEASDHNHPGARDIADRMMASLGSVLLYWHHFDFAQNGRCVDVETDDNTIGGHFLHLLQGRTPSASHVRAMHNSLNLYAEHEFNASTFTARSIAGTGADMYSAIPRAIGALRGPKHGGVNEVAFEVQKRYGDVDEADADIRRRIAAKQVVMEFGHPGYTIAYPRNEVIKEVARRLSREAGSITRLAAGASRCPDPHKSVPQQHDEQILRVDLCPLTDRDFRRHVEAALANLKRTSESGARCCPDPLVQASPRSRVRESRSSQLHYPKPG
ncbi:hypothetical protein GCM10007857_64260 [Bradyrhizobium iriomotense]|uniref:citrate synthase (unknown stereospecificity) n=1 Tax=Bradyrhizobium iriomotense TaxID=441950 RepID=A0ABQ6B5Q3_9BRAD|nr:hypothetical protein GCM10007857_64260 [Bradyrhizobium iriomotense]